MYVGGGDALERDYLSESRRLVSTVAGRQGDCYILPILEVLA